jgi:hypothetical protein
MKNKYLIVLSLCLLASITQGQVGKLFPELKGNTLTDKKITLPQDTKGKFTLLGLAYSKGAEEELSTWFQPVFSTFIEKNKPSLFNESYDVNLYFIPMFTGVNQVASEAASKKMKTNYNEIFHAYVLIYKGELKKYKDQLDFEKKDTPYFFVLDKEGKMIYATSGKYSDDKMEKIESVIAGE